MGTWQGIWLMAKHELKQERWGILISFLFFSYTALIMIGLARPSNGQTMWMGNFFFLSLLPVFGFVVSRTMMRAWTEDSYTHKLAEWRSMPITSQQIAGSRVLQFLLIFTMGWLYLFTLNYVLTGWAQEMEILAYLGFSLVWYGYGAAVGTSYLIFELGVSGKYYMFANLLYMVLYGTVTAWLYVMNISLLGVISTAISQGAWWLPTLVLLLAAGMVWLNYYALCRRIERRSFFH